eukprot:m.132231 g.132231  ORF g.132231 m.132231 type:complete len:580 (+) comp38078_c0_seq1:202-1941(+)
MESSVEPETATDSVTQPEETSKGEAGEQSTKNASSGEDSSKSKDPKESKPPNAEPSAASTTATATTSAPSEQAQGKERWLEFGLGKGVDITRSYGPRGFEKAPHLLEPDEKLVEILLENEGYSKFDKSFTATSDDGSSIGADLNTKGNPIPALQWLQVDFGLDSLKHDDKKSLTKTAAGFQILTRTVSFEQSAVISADRPPSLVETVLDAEKLKAGEEKAGTESGRVEICSAVIASEKIANATHFVDTLQLGAKAFEVYVNRSDNKSEKTSVKGSAGLFSCCSKSTAATTETDGGENGHVHAVMETDGSGGASLNIDMDETKVATSTVSDVQTMCGPGFHFNFAKDADNSGLNVSESQEAAIGFRLAPISELIRDSVWKKAMNTCVQHCYENFLKTAKPLIERDGPFILKAGRFFLRKDGNRLVTTEERKRATALYIHTADLDGISDKPSINVRGVTFNILHKGDGVEEFLCVSTEERVAQLRQNVPGQSYCTFALASIASKEHASVASWGNGEPKVIFRKTSTLKRRQYLAVDCSGGSARLKPDSNDVQLQNEGLPLGGAISLQSQTLLSQFTLHNYP